MSNDIESFDNQENQGFIAGAVLGALAGSIAAMLLTPKTGREMRQVVKEYAKEWEGEAGDFAVEARQIIATIQSALEDGAEEVKQHAPEVASQATQKAAQAVSVVEEGYTNSKDTVSEMVEAFRSQWAELEEGNQEHQPLHHSRFRGINQTWEESASLLTDEDKANQAYVEELKEEVNEADQEAQPSPRRQTLAQYRRATSAKTAAPSQESTKKAPAKSSPKSEEAKPAKTGSRKLLFRRK